MKKLSLWIIILFSLSCSQKNKVDLFAEGKSAESKKDFQKAIELFEQIVNDFPATEYAESSLIHLSFIFNNDLKDARRALSAYQRYYAMFPDGREAPTMLFLSGFIYNNEFHHLDSAKLVYESFLKKYPNHELAPSARFELENLGKDPSQMLQQPPTTENRDHAVPQNNEGAR